MFASRGQREDTEGDAADEGSGITPQQAVHPLPSPAHRSLRLQNFRGTSRRFVEVRGENGIIFAFTLPFIQNSNKNAKYYLSGFTAEESKTKRLNDLSEISSKSVARRGTQLRAPTLIPHSN